MMNQGLVSFIVPIYKAERYIHKCIDSLLAQTYTDIEVILVDDGSPDNCGVICDDYAARDKRVKVIHQQNGGVSAARNTGLWHAVGDYVAFIDADDQVTNDYIEKLSDISDLLDIPVLCYGLKTDSNGELFESISKLIAIADKITEVKQICKCGHKAIMHLRLVNGKPVIGDSIAIDDGKVEYYSVCRRCWKKAFEDGKY